MTKPFFNRIVVLAACICFTALPTGDAEAINTQIQTDNTLSGITAFGVDAARAKQIYTLSEINGKTAGNNLFYSFSNFNIGAGDTASFELETSNLENVISRVTGGFESVIEGKLEMKAAGSSTPSFFFINPAGITLGSGASVDVPGDFYVSTASEVKFNNVNGDVYSAETKNSNLSVASPESFGFLGDESGELKITNITLEFNSGADAGFVAKTIDIKNAGIHSTYGANLQVIATGTKETIPIKPVEPLPIDEAMSGAGKYETMVDAGKLTLNAGVISTTTFNNEDGGNILVQAKTIEIKNHGYISAVTADMPGGANSTGNAGSIHIYADNITMESLGGIFSEINGKGKSSFIFVDAREIDIEHTDTQDDSSRFTGIRARAVRTKSADLYVIADTIKLTTKGKIATATFNNPGITGSPGSISISAKKIRMTSGGEITAETQTLNDGGDIKITVDELYLSGGVINSRTKDGSQGDAGNIEIKTKYLTLDGNGSKISTKARIHPHYPNKEFSPKTTGSPGDITIVGIDSTDEVLRPVKSIKIIGGEITSETQTSVETDSVGKITINAETLELSNDGDYGGQITTTTSGKMDAGVISVVADKIDIVGGSKRESVIKSNTTHSSGNAGSVRIEANKIEIDGVGEDHSTGILSLAEDKNSGSAGDVTIVGLGSTVGALFPVELLNIINGGRISSSTLAQVQADSVGRVDINVRSLNMDNRGQITTSTSGSTDAGAVTIVSESVVLINDSSIESSALKGAGNAGSVSVGAKQIEISGSAEISSSAESGSTGGAGSVSIDGLQGAPAESLNIINGGQISSSTFAPVKADSIGRVDISAQSLNIDNGGQISTSTSGSTDAGAVTIVSETVALTNDSSIESSALKGFGNAGSVSVEAEQVEISDFAVISSSAESASTGSAGSVSVVGQQGAAVELLNITNGGQIRSSTEAEEKADLVGSVDIKVKSLNVANGGQINTETSGQTDAGFITINADQIEIDGQDSRISSSAEKGSTGIAGDVTIVGDSPEETLAESLNITNGGQIDTSTAGSGVAGSIEVSASQIKINGEGSESTGIFSSAEKGSSGLAGEIDINAKNILLSSNGRISIENNAIVKDVKLKSDTAINIDTTNLQLIDSNITANSSGNVDAGDIIIRFKDQVFLDPSTISTQAFDGNGGDIAIVGGDIIFLLDSAITTSVGGLFGNGGNINIVANSLIMSSAFIQANTAASGASGGEVSIKAPTLIPSGSFLQSGGNTPFQFQPFSGINVIQAAAPGGVSGSINASTPQLNLSGMMTNLAIESFDSNALNRNMCTVDEGSSLFQSGKGGVRMRARDFLLSPML